MRHAIALYAAGVAAAAAAGFTATVLGLAALGFLPLAAGLVWAAYDLADVGGPSAEPAPAARRGR